MFDRHFAHWPPGLQRTLDIPHTRIGYNLEVSAARYPDKCAIDYYGTKLSYLRIKTEVRAQEAGVPWEERGERFGRLVLRAWPDSGVIRFQAW